MFFTRIDCLVRTSSSIGVEKLQGIVSWHWKVQETSTFEMPHLRVTFFKLFDFATQGINFSLMTFDHCFSGMSMLQWHTLKAYSDLLSHKSAAAKKNVYENAAKRSSLKNSFYGWSFACYTAICHGAVACTMPKRLVDHNANILSSSKKFAYTLFNSFFAALFSNPSRLAT